MSMVRGWGCFSCSLLGVFPQVRCQFMSAAPLAAKDGTVTAKLRPKKKFRLPVVGAAPLCRQGFVRRAFRARMSSSRRLKQSPLSTSSPRHVKWSSVAFQQDCPRLDDVDDLKTDPASACFPCSCPNICPNLEAIQQRNSVGLRDIDARNLDVYSQEVRSGAWQRVEDESEVLRQSTTRPNPRFVIGHPTST